MNKGFTSFFVGIPLPEQFQNKFEELLKKINKIDSNIETVYRETPHLTVYYLDKQSQANLEGIEKIIERYIHLLKGVRVVVGGMDAFGKESPSVLFLQVSYPTTLAEFNKVLVEKLKRFITFEDQLPFHPHMTVARFISGEAENSWLQTKGEIEKEMNRINWQFPVTEVVIYGVDSSKSPQYQEKLNVIPIN